MHKFEHKKGVYSHVHVKNMIYFTSVSISGKNSSFLSKKFFFFNVLKFSACDIKT